MNGKYMVVGGYGEVGRNVVKQLHQLYPRNVIVAGRSFSKAQACAKTIDSNVEARQLDISEHKDFGAVLANVSMVIMCIDCHNQAFLQNCWENGLKYIDITASVEVISLIESMDQQVASSKSTAILSVGVAPGLTNLLAKYCFEERPDATQIDIVIMLGLGEKHGLAAIEWTLKQLNTLFSLKSTKVSREVPNFSEPSDYYLPFGLGKRVAYRYNFSDQHTLKNTLSFENIDTRLCFDSRIMSRFYYLITRFRIAKLFGYPYVLKSMARLLQRFHLGKELYCVYVQATSPNRRMSMALKGEREALATAQVAATVASLFFEKDLPHGVYHIDQLMDLEQFITAADKTGYSAVRSFTTEIIN